MNSEHGFTGHLKNVCCKTSLQVLQCNSNKVCVTSPSKMKKKYKKNMG